MATYDIYTITLPNGDVCNLSAQALTESEIINAVNAGWIYSITLSGEAADYISAYPYPNADSGATVTLYNSSDWAWIQCSYTYSGGVENIYIGPAYEASFTMPAENIELICGYYS